MQRDNSHDRRRKRDRNLRVTDIGNVPHSIHHEIMYLGMEGLAYLVRRTGKIDQHSAWIDRINREAVCVEPVGNGIQVLLRQTEGLSNLLCGEPFMIVRRSWVMEFLNELLERFFQLGEGAVTGEACAQVANHRQLDRYHFQGSLHDVYCPSACAGCFHQYIA